MFGAMKSREFDVFAVVITFTTYDHQHAPSCPADGVLGMLFPLLDSLEKREPPFSISFCSSRNENPFLQDVLL